MIRTWEKTLWIWLGALPAALFLLSACGDSDEDPKGDAGVDGDADGDADSDTGPPEVFASCNDVVSDGVIRLSDAVNYTFTSSLQVADITVRSAADLTFHWGALTKDFFGRPLNPVTDIDMVLVTLWNMTPEVLAENIRMDNLPLSVNKGAIATFPADSFVQQNLLSFGTPDGSIIPPADLWRYFDTTQTGYQYPQDQYTFMLIGAHGTALGKDSRMLQFFHLDPNVAETTVALTDNSMTLDYTTNLVTTMPVPVPASIPNLTVDWENMATDALGNEFIPTKITEAMVAYYPNLTRRQLDEQFLNLREIAAKKWIGEVESGFTIDLSTLVDETGNPTFAGVDHTGVWLAALFCTTCNNPAPWVIAILQPCP